MTRQDVDRTIDELAVAQHGVVGRRQLLQVGVAAHVIDRRVAGGRLTRVHRGVYRVGPLAPPWAEEMAAVLASGENAALCAGSAGALWQVLPAGERPVPPHVAVPGRNCRPAGVRVHRVAVLGPAEVTRCDGIPVTAPARTLVDLGGSLGARALERAVAEAFALRLTGERGLRRQLARHPGARGVRAIRALLGADLPLRTRSEAEERFLALVTEAGLPRPRGNVRVLGMEVDFCWPDESLIVEIDGLAFHHSPPSFERDRRRHDTLAAAGFTILRFTWTRLVEEPKPVIGQVALALGISRGRRWRAAPTPPAAAR